MKYTNSKTLTAFAHSLAPSSQHLQLKRATCRTFSQSLFAGQSIQISQQKRVVVNRARIRMTTGVASSIMTKNKMLHVVYRAGDLQKTKEFLSTLGMHVLRERDIPEEKYSNVFMGFGPEKKGEYFSIELTHNYGVDSYDIGDFGSIGVAVHDVAQMVSKLEKNGYEIDTKPKKENDNVSAVVKDPTGYKYELIERSQRDPMNNITLPVPDLEKAISFYRAIGMKEVEAKKDGKATMGYDKDSTHLVLKHVPGSAPKSGTGYGQIAISTPDIYKAADAVEKAGFEVARKPGPVPGIGTKICAVKDQGWKTVLVDEQDFEKEFE